MLTRLLLRNFKGWESTGPIRLAPITVFFGSNSSGKTSLLQSILLLKQTAESLDRTRVLHPGDERTLVDLGTIPDLLFDHATDRRLGIELGWRLPEAIALPDGRRAQALDFEVEVGVDRDGQASVARMAYAMDAAGARAAMIRRDDGGYDLATVPEVLRRADRPGPLPAPIRFYGFPGEVANYFQGAGWLADLALALERRLDRVHYVGPLREYPKRSYLWAGEKPVNVWPRGELAVPALLAARREGRAIARDAGRGRGGQEPFEAVIARWLKRMGVIDDFSVRPIARGRKEYEVRVRQTRRSAEVLITDVGFGVSQLLPVLVQSYYAAPDSTVIFEQPEIHLHPRVQADLADVLVDAYRRCRVQFVVESHSEHFLRRLQRRVAEAERIRHDEVALYTCEVEGGRSTIHALEVDEFGNIANWPRDFFGDEMGDLAAMTLAGLKRQEAREAGRRR